MYKGKDFHITPLTTKDAAQLHELIVENEDYFKSYLPNTVAANMSIEQSEAFIRSISEDEKRKKQFLFALKTSTSIVGLVYLKDLDWNTKEGEFAYCISKQYTGQGWITKAVTLLSSYASSQLQLKTINIIVHHSNIASIRIAEKCGFTYKGVLPNEFTPPGKKPIDMQLFKRTL